MPNNGGLDGLDGLPSKCEFIINNWTAEFVWENVGYWKIISDMDVSTILLAVLS
jgi:hypothetical protein